MHEVKGAQPGPGTALLSARQMSKSFGAKLAVDQVDLDLYGGEVHALLGENGAGKSTLISMLSGQYRPDSGEVDLRGETTRFTSPKDSLRAGIGVVYQDFRLVEDFSVLDNLVLGTSERPGRPAWARAEELMAQVGFELPRDTRVARLSVGEKQQLEILKLLFRGADVLILDEPTAVLTPQQSESLFAALRLLAGQGKAIMFVSHKLREVSAVADRVTVLRGGRQVLTQPMSKASPADLATMMMGSAVAEQSDVAPGGAADGVLVLRGVATEGGRRSSLHDVDLHVGRGEIVGIAGVSGNGQTDLAEIAAGTREPHHGTLRRDGPRVAFVPEDRLGAGLVGAMTIAENLALRSYRDGRSSARWFVSRRAMAKRAEPLIAQFGIPASPTTRAGELSGGGQQRTILARELSSEPDLLVICQPTRGLDVVSARTIHDLVVGVRDAGAGVLLISEDLDELLRLADRIVVLSRGRVVAEQPRAEATRASIGAHMTDAAPTDAAQTDAAETGAVA